MIKATATCHKQKHKKKSTRKIKTQYSFHLLNKYNGTHFGSLLYIEIAKTLQSLCSKVLNWFLALHKVDDFYNYFHFQKLIPIKIKETLP